MGQLSRWILCIARHDHDCEFVIHALHGLDSLGPIMSGALTSGYLTLPVAAALDLVMAPRRLAILPASQTPDLKAADGVSRVAGNRAALRAWDAQAAALSVIWARVQYVLLSTVFGHRALAALVLLLHPESGAEERTVND